MSKPRTKYLDRPFQLKSVDADGSFTGYGSVFGELDSYRDIMMPGAFNDSLKEDFTEKNRKVPMLWQHDTWNPIGVYDEIYEDTKGLWLKGQCNMEVQQGRECHALMKQGALTGLSIGYNTVNYMWKDDEVTRELHKVRLWEVSPVTFPAGDSARVESVKEFDGLITLSDVENHLRDAYGLSRKEACGLIARIKQVPAQSESADVERALKNVRAILNSINL